MPQRNPNEDDTRTGTDDERIRDVDGNEDFEEDDADEMDDEEDEEDEQEGSL